MPFFHANTKAVELTTKNVYGLRILPAFQRDESRLPINPTSFIAYRDAANVPADTGKAAFTDWYYSFKGYKFIGNDGRGFLSPLMMSKTDQRGIDPLFDCYHLARNSKESHPEWYALTEKGEGDMNAVLEKYRLFAAMNVAMEVDNAVVNRIAVVTKASLDHLKEQLDVLCSRSDTPNDANWADFMLGDVTDPYVGLWASVAKGKFNTAGMEASLFKFSAAKDRLVNVNRFPVDPANAWGAEILAGRADISDLEKVTRIPEAGEILEYIVNDGFLPMELIREACQNHWDIPEPKAKRTTMPPAGGGGFAPPAGAPPRPPGAPPVAPSAPTPPVSNRQFWAVLPSTGAVSQAPMPETVIQSLVNQHKQHLQVMLVGGNTWHSTQEFGINLPVAPQAPAAPQPPAAPPAPPQAPAAPRPPGMPPQGGPPRPPGQQQPPRTLAPSGPPAGAPAPLAPPGVGHAPTPPPQRPAPVQPPAAPPQPPTAPAAYQPPAPPAAQPTAPAAPAAPVANAPAQPLSEAEMLEYQSLEKDWVESCGSGGQMPPEKIQRYSELADRHSAAVAAQG